MACLKKLNCTFARQRGSHRHYRNTKGGLVTVPMNVDLLDEDLMRSIIKQSGASRKEFYRATKASAKKLQK
ncbi:type II toxin-antitoxin system HicA family toxin [bacterium]|nr:type II toxin-antitoxin system HicA family toxin [bacterium]